MRRRIVKGLTLPLMLTALAAPASAGVSCADLEKQFSELYRHVGTSCAEHRDCVLGDYDWDPCVAKAVSKEQIIGNFAETRAGMHRLCGYVAKPCPAVIEPVYCVKKKCAMSGELLKRHPVLRFRVPSVKNGEFTLHADTGIRCATAPCPASEEIYRGRVKNHRFTLPLTLFLTEEPGKKPEDGRPAARRQSRPGPETRRWFMIDGKAAGADIRAWIKDLPGEITLNP
ncbi:MAG: hypothetical protein AB1734_04760 [Elusimicrobiota bacterium]